MIPDLVRSTGEGMGCPLQNSSTWEQKYQALWASLVAQMVKNLPAMQETGGFDPWVRKIIWRREWQPTPVLLPGESHGQKSLVVFSPWGHKELGMAGQLTHGHRNS